MRLSQTMQDGQKWFHIDQQRDIAQLIEDNHIEATRPVSAPMPNKNTMYSDPTPLTPKQHNKYRSIVGSLQYFATWTQWHLAHPIARLAQQCASPTLGAQRQLEHTLAWLSQNSDRKLSGPVVSTTTWTVYSDSDHAGDRVFRDTRSHTGVLILCNGVPVHWRSKKQPVTSTSSAAAEIYAMAEAVRDSRLNAWKAEELGYPKRNPIDILVDNAASVVFQTKMKTDSKIKGVFDLRDKWVQELQDTAEVRAVKVATEDNLADILTKCLGRNTYEMLVDKQKNQANAVGQAAATAAA